MNIAAVTLNDWLNKLHGNKYKYMRATYAIVTCALQWRRLDTSVRTNIFREKLFYSENFITLLVTYTLKLIMFTYIDIFSASSPFSFLLSYA